MNSKISHSNDVWNIGGLIIQSATITDSSSGNKAVTFSKPFPSKCMWCMIRVVESSSDSVSKRSIGFSINKTGFTYYHTSTSSPFNWIAIGY